MASEGSGAFRVVFMGTPAFAVPALGVLVEAALKSPSDRRLGIAAVYTKPPRPSGRGLSLKGGPIYERARALGLPLRVPANFRSAEEVADFAALGCDLAIVAAYGLILPPAVLAAPRHGCLNLHASLLPRWRGAAPIQRAMQAGDSETGIDLMVMDVGLDTGPVLARARTPIHSRDTLASLHDRLSEMGADLLRSHLPRLMGPEAAEFIASAEAQDGDGAVYAPRISPDESRIDWTLDAAVVDRRIRAFSPQPGAFFMLPEALGGARVKVLFSGVERGAGAPGEVLDHSLLVACGTGAVRLLRLQREGRQAMPLEAFLRGHPFEPGMRLG